MTKLDKRHTSETERATASTTVDYFPGTVFVLLADPSAHADRRRI
jgi:hypothetical protein